MPLQKIKYDDSHQIGIHTEPGKSNDLLQHPSVVQHSTGRSVNRQEGSAENSQEVEWSAVSEGFGSAAKSTPLQDKTGCSWYGGVEFNKNCYILVGKNGHSCLIGQGV